MRALRSKVKDLGTTKVVLLSLIWITGLADIITFLMGNISFEANPIYLLTKSIIFLISFKIVILTGLSYLFIKYRPKKRYIWAYMWCFLCVYIILAQCLGVYSNIKVTHEYETSPPGTVVPLEPKEAAINYSLIYGALILYFPMFLSLIAFWCFERIYL